MLLKIILIVVAILFMITLVVKRFVYFQPTYEFLPPVIVFQDIYEGYLHAWYKEGPKGPAGKVILFCHGNGGNLSTRQDKLVNLAKMGYSVLIFDYSGYGQSRGVPNEEMCYANAEMFYKYLLRHGYSSTNIIPYGESLGSAVASYVARKYNLPSVIIESGITCVKDIVKLRIPKLLGFIGVLFPEFNTLKYLTGYSGKSLVMHCQNDEIIPMEYAQQLLSIASVPVVMDGTHNMPEIPWERVAQFIG